MLIIGDQSWHKPPALAGYSYTNNFFQRNCSRPKGISKVKLWQLLWLSLLISLWSLGTSYFVFLSPYYIHSCINLFILHVTHHNCRVLNVVTWFFIAQICLSFQSAVFDHSNMICQRCSTNVAGDQYTCAAQSENQRWSHSIICQLRFPA